MRVSVLVLYVALLAAGCASLPPVPGRDNFCVRLEKAHHEAIHGGGNWRLGRTWPGEWNRTIMEALLDAEAKAGRMLTRDEILKAIAKRMRDYRIPMNFIRGRGQ